MLSEEKYDPHQTLETATQVKVLRPFNIRDEGALNIAYMRN